MPKSWSAKLLGYGSKIGTHNRTLVNGNIDQNLRSPGGLILTHTHLEWYPDFEKHFWEVFGGSALRVLGVPAGQRPAFSHSHTGSHHENTMVLNLMARDPVVLLAKENRKGYQSHFAGPSKTHTHIYSVAVCSFGCNRPPVCSCEHRIKPWSNVDPVNLGFTAALLSFFTTCDAANKQTHSNLL